MKRKRGYSTAFRPRRGAGRAYHLGRIPIDLWTAAEHKARASGISMRALLLKLLADWTAAS